MPPKAAFSTPLAGTAARTAAAGDSSTAGRHKAILRVKTGAEPKAGTDQSPVTPRGRHALDDFPSRYTPREIAAAAEALAGYRGDDSSLLRRVRAASGYAAGSADAHDVEDSGPRTLKASRRASPPSEHQHKQLSTSVAAAEMLRRDGGFDAMLDAELMGGTLLEAKTAATTAAKAISDVRAYAQQLGTGAPDDRPDREQAYVGGVHYGQWCSPVLTPSLTCAQILRGSALPWNRRLPTCRQRPWCEL